MIDCHSHILPAVDDGAMDLAEAIQMLAIARKDGVSKQVLTPHIHPDHFDNTCSSIRERFDGFATELAPYELSIELALAGEFRLCPQLLKMCESEDMLWLGEWCGKKALLLELPHNMLPLGSMNVIRWLHRNDIQPILVHPERNRELQLKMHLIQEFVDNGCLLQITAGSLIGQFGIAAKNIAIKLLSQNLVNFMASDAHNVSYRPPNLAAGVAEAAGIIGADAALKLVTEAPERLLSSSRKAA